MPNDRPASILWTRREAAAALGVSVRHLDQLIRRGVIPAIRLGQLVRFRPAAIEDALAKLEGAPRG